jgi:AcrR family transcriptional regulator
MTATAPTRERLLDAAGELLEEGGYAAASVIAVAQRAGVAAGTLYRHYGSKEELFVELFRAVCDRELEAMRAAAAAPAQTPTERVAGVLTTFAQRALGRPRLAWALIAEPVSPGVDAERLTYRARYAELLADRLRAAIDAGELPEQDVGLTAAALVGGCAEALVGPLASGRAGAEATIAALRTFVLRAVGAG